MANMSCFSLVFVFCIVVNGSPADEVDDTCVLHVKNESHALFTDTILRKRFNFMYMKLNFTDLDVQVRAKKHVIRPEHWIWTYKGEDGGHEYLFLPEDFGYLSFGLLWSKSDSSEYPISLYHSGNCSRLTLGQNKSDLLVGEALGNMTSDIAARNDLYNSSYWCYNRRLFIQPSTLYRACANTICTLQNVEYVCCKYVINFVSRERHVECSKEHYHFIGRWWFIPVIVGEICFALYPLLLTTIAGKLQKQSKKSNIQTKDESESEDTPPLPYLRLRHNYPITLITTVFTPCLKISIFQGTLCSRFLRPLVIFLPMIFPAVRLYLDTRFASDFVKESVEKGAIFDFSSMIAGFNYSKRFLYVLGGPYVAVILHVTFGTLLMTFPENLESLLVKGLFKPKKSPYFIFAIPLKTREKLGRMSLKRCSGYRKIHNYLLLQLHMIINWKFWRHILRIFRHRWTADILPFIRRWACKPLSYCVMFIVFPLHLVFCIIETVFCLVYFAAPVVSCFFITINAYITALRNHFGNRSWSVYIFSRLFIAGTVIAFCITWYMSCVIFFDSFWLITRVIMFTYTGIIQFPRLSYGYIVLVFMTFFYIMESLNNFGANYRELLKLTIDVCEKVQSKTTCEFAEYLINKNAIPVQLFNIIIERHLPKRVQVLMVVIKVSLIVSILWLSIDLLTTFDKFQDLSLVSHVFTVLFVCALPKICRELCIKQHRHKTRTILRQRIYRTVTEYCNKDGNMESSSDVEAVSGYCVTGYETLDVESE